MSSKSKPAIIFVPGAWHSPIHYQLVTSRLELAGYEVYPLHLPSIGTKDKDPDTPSHDPDVAFIASAIRNAADAGKEILVAMHSAGGVTGSEACKDLSKASRSTAGLPGGVVRLVYIAAFARPEGRGVYTTTGGPSPWINVIGGHTFPSDPEWRFYHDVDSEQTRVAVENLAKHSLAAMWSDPTYAAWKHIPSTYLVCENDRAIQLPKQEAMIAAEGADFEVERCQAGHSPMLSMPDFTAEVIRRAAGEDVKSQT